MPSSNGRLSGNVSILAMTLSASRVVAGPWLDSLPVCTQFARMTRKTISLDADVYRQLCRKKTPTESLSAALRRLLTDEKDPADYLDEMMAEPPVVDTDLLRRRQLNPPRSPRRRRAA